MAYTPHTQNDLREMLNFIGLENVEELFSPIKKELRAKSFNIKEGLSEFETYEELETISLKNNVDKTLFIGGGYYDHIIPSAVDALTLRSEFYTAYTPYQAEASQGTLQALYEYQSAICRITGMEVTNGSMYDGATALAEGALMAIRITNRNKVVVDYGVNPIYKEVLKTYLKFHNIEIVELGENIAKRNDEDILNKLDDKTACFIYATPDFFGNFRDFTDINQKIKDMGVLSLQSVYPLALALFKSPASMNADIVSADGQSLGIPLSFGGPYFGILASKEKYLRDLPGRIAGRTLDKDGKTCYSLTLQAREQHIRRQRATSNICSNQNLCAIRGLIFISLFGKNGLKDLAILNYQKNEYFKSLLKYIKEIEIINKDTTFNEFVIKTPISSKEFIKKLSAKNIAGGISLSNFYENSDDLTLVCTTEKRTKEEIQYYVSSVKEILCN